ncbi:MAG: hypothetical protein HY298_06165 [Verrucomicrobia bacterium]|nr:hypothetical protein [Verrucomicrobiota bacterium]
MRKGLLLSAAWTLFGIAALSLFLGYWPILSSDLDVPRGDGLEARSELGDKLLLTVFYTVVAAMVTTIGTLLRKSARKNLT